MGREEHPKRRKLRSRIPRQRVIRKHLALQKQNNRVMKYVEAVTVMFENPQQGRSKNLRLDKRRNVPLTQGELSHPAKRSRSRRPADTLFIVKVPSDNYLLTEILNDSE
jgi:hypothetical protein